MARLNEELGAEEWVRRTGLPLAVSFTVTKLRWLRDNEPENARRTAAVALPHDYLTWRLRGYGAGSAELEQLTTDRSDASGTAYWSGVTVAYCEDLFELGLGSAAVLPRVLGPTDRAGFTGHGIPGIPPGVPLGVGGGDNAVAALALALQPGDAVISLGTSGTVYARTTAPVQDMTSVVSSYSDATGDHLPIVATLNAARDLDAAAALLGRVTEPSGAGGHPADGACPGGRPAPGEYVAEGAAMQAVAALEGHFPHWDKVMAPLPQRGLRPEIMAQHEGAKRSLGYT